MRSFNKSVKVCTREKCFCGLILMGVLLCVSEYRNEKQEVDADNPFTDKRGDISK